ncbi:MAG TPA: CDC27 family protein [Williamwhitmania sp.]|nr:CDC27 family protein [Williamwhitmania sp.]
MIRKLYITLVGILLLQGVVFQAYAQNAKVDSIRTQGQVLFNGGDFAKALPYCEKLHELFPSDGKYLYQTGVCLLKQTRQTDRAYTLLMRASQMDVPVQVYYYLGVASRLLYRFDEAIDYFRRYMVSGGHEISGEEVEKQVSMCENGSYLIKYATDVEVLAKAKTVADSLLLYYSVAPGKGRLAKLPDELMSKLDKHKKIKFPQAIYYPSASDDEPQVIYFSSYGKTDLSGMNIWKTEKISAGEWGQPVALPKEINSGGDEIFPIPARDGAVLYFSSNNLYGMGGYDIFKTTYDSVANKWSTPENLGFPINSPYDDFCFVPNSNGDTAIFASNREVTGDSIVVYKVKLSMRGVKKSLSGLDEVTELAKLNPINRVKDSSSSLPQSRLQLPKARVAGLQYDLTYMGLMARLFQMRQTQDSLQTKLNLLRQEYTASASSKTDSFSTAIVLLERRLMGLNLSMDEVNKKAIAMEQNYLTAKQNSVQHETTSARSTQNLPVGDFLSNAKVQTYFGAERIAALDRLTLAAQRLDTSLSQSMEVLRQRQDLETMLSVAETQTDIGAIKKSLNALTRKPLVVPNDFLEKRLLVSVGIRQLYLERVQEDSNNEEVKGYVEAGTGDLFASQTVLNNGRRDTVSIDSYEGIRDAIWLEERGITRYQLAIATLLDLPNIDSLKNKLQHLLHKSTIPFYSYSSTPAEQNIGIGTLKPESRLPEGVQVKIKPSYNEGLSVVDPFPYNAANPIPMDDPLPNGVVYRIQLGAFSQPVNYSVFKGLAPLSGEVVKGGSLKKYFAGLFENYRDAQSGLVLVKSKGFSDAYVVSWVNGKITPTARAQNFEQRKPKPAHTKPTKNVDEAAQGNTLYRVVIGTFESSIPPQAVAILNAEAKGKEVAKKIIAEDAVSYSVGNFTNFEEAFKVKQALLAGGYVEAYVTTVVIEE